MRCSIDSLVREAVASLDERCFVQEAAELMARENVGSLVVTSEGRVVGLFTERDLLRRVVGAGRDARTLAVGEVCSRNLVSIAHDRPCREAVRTMQAHLCRRLVVYRGSRFAGLVHLTDLANAMAERGSGKDLLVNVFGTVTLLVAIGVIAMLFYQLPEMLQLAERVSGD